MSNFASVALDGKLSKLLDYAVPSEMASAIQVGMRVEIPFRSSTKRGTIVELKNSSSIANLKSIAKIVENHPFLSEPLWKLAHWISSYYCAPLQKTLRCFIPPPVREERSRTSKTFDVSQEEFFPSQPKVLNEEQRQCLSEIYASLQKNAFAPHLIHGVTGSGKTEIYLQAIEETLRLGRGAILLVPEISLTSQTIERFRSRFQEKIAIWHHRRTVKERSITWEELKAKKTRIVIGARSAIFCPMPELGLIIVDEEHDSSYKQSEESPCYNARDVCVMRAKFEQATVLLGSATPSIESRYNAEVGKYTLNKLQTRAGSAAMPKIHIVDMKREYEMYGSFTHFSSVLIEALKQRLEAGEQSLLFLNRRGYHRLQICASCRCSIKCPHCDLALTFHKADEVLQCHLCDYQQKVPLTCPSCAASGSLQFKGFGTEHVERALHALFPNVRTLRMDRDTTRRKEGHEEIYRQFRAHKADVLIGTQMIAKGLHFPAVTLVGVLQADAPLTIPDFRSQETTFQLVTQVAGRAGRSDLAGEVILQTLLPDHDLFRLAANQDYEAFYSKELQERRLFSYPPFCHLVKITCSGDCQKKTEIVATDLHAKFKPLLNQDATLLPVVAAGHAKVRDKYRFQFIIKCRKVSALTKVLELVAKTSVCKIDVDTNSTFF